MASGVGIASDALVARPSEMTDRCAGGSPQPPNGVLRITALRAAPRGRVKIELDGELWRTVPIDVVLVAGLRVGVVLDRDRVRVLRRELRSREALRKASRLLSRRDLSERGLGDELARRRVAPAARRETSWRRVEAGAIADERLARGRAQLLAARGAGNTLIRADLESQGLDREVVEDALDALEPEPERARRITEARGPGPATARFLARRGFDGDCVEDALRDPVAEEG
jgi:SOS response regulatory protein OraA/RecX